MVNCTWPWCVHSDPAATLALDLHAHTQLYCLLLLGQRGGGVHVLKCIFFFSHTVALPAAAWAGVEGTFTQI